MEFFKNIIKKILYLALFILYIYLFFNNLYNSFYINNHSFNTIPNNHYNIELFKSKSFQKNYNIINNNIIFNIIYGDKLYSNKEILKIINNNINDVINDTNMKEDIIRNDSYIYFINFRDNLNLNNKGYSMILKELLSTNNLNKIYILLFTCLLITTIICNDFSWIKNNGYILCLSSSLYFLLFYLISKIFNLSSNNILIIFLKDIFKDINVINFNYCSLYFMLGVISVIIYIILNKINNKKIKS